MAEENNSMRGMMKETYGENRVDKSNELNDTMTIQSTSPDEYTRKIMNIGGSEDGK